MQLRADAKVIVAQIEGGKEALLVVDGGEEPGVYGAEDWRDASSPSYAYDQDGDLRRHNGQRCYGDALEVVSLPIAEAEALLRRTWPDQDGVWVTA